MLACLSSVIVVVVLSVGFGAGGVTGRTPCVPIISVMERTDVDFFMRTPPLVVSVSVSGADEARTQKKKGTV